MLEIMILCPVSLWQNLRTLRPLQDQMTRLSMSKRELEQELTIGRRQNAKEAICLKQKCQVRHELRNVFFT